MLEHVLLHGPLPEDPVKDKYQVFALLLWAILGATPLEGREAPGGLPGAEHQH